MRFTGLLLRANGNRASWSYRWSANWGYTFWRPGAPAFPLSALSWDYSTHTWHTNRDTYDKLVFDDLRNNVVLTASLVYLSADDPEFVDRTRRTVIAGQNGQPGSWPTCQPAHWLHG